MHSSPDLSALRAAVRGAVVLPGDPGYDAARRPWNLAVEQHPAAVVEPVDFADLRAVVAIARDAGTPVAVQPSGHGASGDLAGAVLVRMNAFDDLDIDLSAGRARIGSGVRWGVVVDALEGTGWAAPAGTSPVVTVAGYTLGGGALVVQPHGGPRRAVAPSGLGPPHRRAS
ncbi:FAD-binding oxidoreductase [Microbacterium sp. XT11]|uniref:FAD-binding oxidoreductase n=1 Tax=Microbacterium sp. XT11 TaxID=367477 RepID=UPI00082AD4B4|nr:FAD-binding protein [Microbacterium sp. XT11]